MQPYSADETIPVRKLIVLEGSINEEPARILKDDGCNTNVASKEFFLRHRELFETRDENTDVTHSNKNNSEISNEIVLNGLIQCGSHRYRSNFAVANCRYDVLLGMPWHTDVQPRIDYGIPEVEVADTFLPLERNQCFRVSISNIGVKKFRSLLRKKGHQEDFEVFGLIEDDSNRLWKRGTNGRQQWN